MSKNRPTPTTGKPPSGASRGPGSLPLFIRLAVSLVVVWHLAGIFLAAWSIPPTSPLIASVAQRPPMQWYLDALYLNHGYQFFAPDPGEGHLVRYQAMDRAGSVIQQDEFPSTKQQWPRLRYHRYFMLADQAGVPMPDEADRAYWERRYLEGYARQLLRQHADAEMVRVSRVAHYPLFPDHAIAGRKLDDPETYRTLLEVVQRRSDLGPEATDQGRAGQYAPNRTPYYPQQQNAVGRGNWQGIMR